jgi:hypothetical protein
VVQALRLLLFRLAMHCMLAAARAEFV